MAVSTVARLNRPTRKTFGLVATADADTTINILHGMAIPGFSLSTLVVRVQNYLAAGRVSDWIVSNVTLTTVTLTKTTDAGSGDPGEQAVVDIALPHTIVGNAIPAGL